MENLTVMEQLLREMRKNNQLALNSVDEIERQVQKAAERNAYFAKYMAPELALKKA